MPRLLVDSKEIKALVNSPSKKVSIRKIREIALTSDRVLVSCRCKAECASRKYCCFKEGKRYLVHFHANAEYNCRFLATVTARTKSILRDKDRSKRRGETAGADKVENCITVDG